MLANSFAISARATIFPFRRASRRYSWRIAGWYCAARIAAVWKTCLSYRFPSRDRLCRTLPAELSAPGTSRQ